MKKLFVLLFLVISLGAKAQTVNVQEPEFADEVLLLTSDSTASPLERENAYFKMKMGAGLYIVGVGKVKTRITLKGNTSPSKVVGGTTTRLIIKAKDNLTDPKSFISVMKFDVKSKERNSVYSEAGTFSSVKTGTGNYMDYKAKKYGESSYYVVLENLEAGEYGIMLGDPNTDSKKNDMKITTFSVK